MGGRTAVVCYGGPWFAACARVPNTDTLDSGWDGGGFGLYSGWPVLGSANGALRIQDAAYGAVDCTTNCTI